jgi:hypothetical protein
LEFASLAIPAALLSLVSVLVDVNQTGPSGAFGLTLLVTAAGIIFTLATVVASDEVRQGRPIDLGASIARGLSRTVTAILSAIAFFLTFLGLGLGLGLVIAIPVLANLAVPAVVIAVAGACLLAYVGIRWALAQAAIVLDGLGPLAALNGSWRVSRGNAVRMVGLYVLIGLITVPIGVGVALLSIASPDVRFGALLAAVVTLVTVPIATIASTTVYGDLTGRPFDPTGSPSRRTGRRVLVGTLVVLGILGAAIAIPSIGPALDRLVSQSIPAADRGVVRFGTTANPGNPCRPLDQKTDFATSDAIYIGGYFTTAVPAGQVATESIYTNGTLLGQGDLAGASQASACFSEASPVTGAPPGSYRVEVTYQGQTIASGEFTVH